MSPICTLSGYCISNTGDNYINDYYVDNGLYDGSTYWSGQTNGYFIYYSTGQTQWCLSSSLGGSCLLSGQQP